MSLVAIGAYYVDTILRCVMSFRMCSGPVVKGNTHYWYDISTSHYPAEDEKLRASNISHRQGGNCANTLQVLQQLTATSRQRLLLNLVAVLPAKSSVASQQLMTALEPHVQLCHSIYRENFQEPASCYIIKSQSTGSRTIVNYNELPDMTVEDFIRITDEMGPRATWFHFEVCVFIMRSLIYSYIHLGSHTCGHSRLYSTYPKTVPLCSNQCGVGEVWPRRSSRTCGTGWCGILLKELGTGNWTFMRSIIEHGWSLA